MKSAPFRVLSSLRAFSIALLIVLTSLQFANAQYAPAVALPQTLQPGADTITAEQAKDFLEVLASPAFEGRGTGQIGYMKAAHWVAGKLAEFGLEPAGNNDTYFQMMPIIRRSPDMNECKIVGPAGLEIAGQGNLGFERYTNEAEVTGEVVFVCLQGAEPQLPADVSLRDKIVIYTSDEAAFARAPRLLTRARPAATLRIVDTKPVSVAQTIFPGRKQRSARVSGTILVAAANQLAAAFQVPANWNTRPNVQLTGQQISIRMQMREEQAGAPNVVALLKGSDPELVDEYIVIGAHLDHLGIRNGTINPGADDNGSGSVAVLSIARAMAENPVKPKRSVLFMWFAAEEVGLLGSKYYTEHPIFPLDKMTCMLNIDMVGRNEDNGEGDAAADNEGHIHLVGSQKGDNALHEIILNANRHVGFQFELDMESVWNRSDQVNFFNQGVPVAFMFGGFHPDYHQPSDKVEAINFKKIAAAAKLYYLSAYGAAAHGKFEANP